MSKPYMMVQCVLERHNTQLVSWIPERFAVQGKILKIKTCEGWSNGWSVKTVYGCSKKSVDEVDRMNTDYRHQREASDI